MFLGYQHSSVIKRYGFLVSILCKRVISDYKEVMRHAFKNSYCRSFLKASTIGIFNSMQTSQLASTQLISPASVHTQPHSTNQQQAVSSQIDSSPKMEQKYLVLAAILGAMLLLLILICVCANSSKEDNKSRSCDFCVCSCDSYGGNGRGGGTGDCCDDSCCC